MDWYAGYFERSHGRGEPFWRESAYVYIHIMCVYTYTHIYIQRCTQITLGDVQQEEEEATEAGTTPDNDEKLAPWNSSRNFVDAMAGVCGAEARDNVK